MRQSKAKRIIAIIVVLIAMVYLFWDILDLFNTKDKHKVEVIYSFEALEVTHKLFGFIPIGKDHYYLAYNEDANGVITGYVVKASKDWYEENFYPESGGARFTSDDLNGVVIDSLSKGYRTRWVKEVQDRAVEFQEQIYETNGNYNIEVLYPYGLDNAFVLNYKTTAFLKIALLVFTFILTAIGIVIAKRKTAVNQVAGKVYLIAVAADVVFFLIMLLNSL